MPNNQSSILRLRSVQVVNRPVAVFDSGVGGLSVLRHLRAELSHEPILYLADQANVPYGSRSLTQIRAFSEAITHYLLQLGAKIIVVACNTASGAALTHLRQTFPGVLFVGMEPAVKPAARQTKSGKVGVLATAGTFESQRYEALMARFGQGVDVFENPCLGLVDLIEAGNIDGPETETMLRACVVPMVSQGVDTLVLGCTHYPFVRPLLEKIAGPAVTIIDPAPAVVRQTIRLLRENELLAEDTAVHPVTAITTGPPARLEQFANQMLSFPIVVKTAVWHDGQLK
ncbi:MAG: glutamate racemase [Ardenticatenaceae bacterium]|nr:glutamate racemase [Ardenticatenaceae bacterium]MCB9443631.1 glutamate racemase [Ardenticatenaceae bacterium]